MGAYDECGVCNGDNSTCVDYQSQIQQSIFNIRCTNCHGSSGGLNLTTHNNLMNGGESGAVIIPGNASASLLWQHVNSGSMPLGSSDLSQSQVNLIEAWINQGAND